MLSWEDVLKRHEGAWDTVVWFSALVMMASFTRQAGADRLAVANRGRGMSTIWA
ncbi:anion permease [Serratia ureilytica]